MKRMHCSLILSHLQFAIRNGKYNAQTDPIFKSLKLSIIKDTLDVQCMKFRYKFGNNNVPTLLPFSDTTLNCMTCKLESVNFYIYIWFVLPMPTMPRDIEFSNCYANFNCRPRKNPHSQHFFICWPCQISSHRFLLVWSRNAIYVQGQHRNIIHLYQQWHSSSWSKNNISSLLVNCSCSYVVHHHFSHRQRWVNVSSLLDHQQMYPTAGSLIIYIYIAQYPSTFRVASS